MHIVKRQLGGYCNMKTMKNTRIPLTVIILVCCVNVLAQTSKKTTVNNVKAVAEKVHALETSTEKLFLDLQKENKVLKELLQKMESEIALYRDDVRDKVAEMNSNMSNWMTILSLVISALTAILGIVAPLLLNWTQNKAYKKKLSVLEGKVRAAKEDAESAKSSLESVNDLKNDVDKIKQEIMSSEVSAKTAAEKAEISRLFTEALAEHDKNPQKAMDLYTKILEIDSNYVKAYNNRGGIRKKIVDIEGAMADYNKAIDLKPNNASAYNNRADLKFHIGKMDEALDDFNKAIELSPENAYILNNRADFLLKINKLDEAMTDIDRSIKINNSIPYSYFTKGEIYKAMEKYTEAILEFSHAISIKNDIKKAYELRAECYRELSKNTEDKVKKEEYNALAEADERKFENLHK